MTLTDNGRRIALAIAIVVILGTLTLFCLYKNKVTPDTQLQAQKEIVTATETALNATKQAYSAVKDKNIVYEQSVAKKAIHDAKQATEYDTQALEEWNDLVQRAKAYIEVNSK